jgi:alcohol dehydrogenase
MHIPTHLEGIRNQDISRLARYADKEANPLYPVPVLMDRHQLETIYRQVSSKEERHDSAAD